MKVQVCLLRNEMLILWNSISYESFEKAILSYYGSSLHETNQILDQSNSCQVIRLNEFSQHGWQVLDFIIDVELLTIKEAISTTGIGAVILTHVS